ncbi:MAG: Lrp/AsnC family transcriptional regulator [Candidatus Lokiarchaeota archaeon]|nr:Lrp/AsnC family transcriptional regulator [Candidatus Harpocratesius repetitus]
MPREPILNNVQKSVNSNNIKNSSLMHKEIELSDIDKKILQILQEDGKASFRKIAKKLNSSVSTIKNHVDKLTETGVIKAYSALIDCCKIGYKEMLLLSIRVNNVIPIQDIFNKLIEIEKINSIYQISGNYSIFCMAKCIEKEDQIQLLEKVKFIPGIEEIHTQVVLQCVKEDIRISIP